MARFHTRSRPYRPWFHWFLLTHQNVLTTIGCKSEWNIKSKTPAPRLVGNWYSVNVSLSASAGLYLWGVKRLLSIYTSNFPLTHGMWGEVQETRSGHWVARSLKHTVTCCRRRQSPATSQGVVLPTFFFFFFFSCPHHEELKPLCWGSSASFSR